MVNKPFSGGSHCAKAAARCNAFHRTQLFETLGGRVRNVVQSSSNRALL